MEIDKRRLLVEAAIGRLPGALPAGITMSARFLVIGGSGFTGGFVLDEMTRRGLDVVAMARSAQTAEKLRSRGVDVVAGDLDVTHSLERAMREAKADRLVNLASLGFGHAPMLVSTAERVGFDHCIFISTTAIFTKLDAASRAVRVAAEDAIFNSSLSWSVLRPTMIYGAPGDRNMERLLNFLARSSVVPLPAGGANLQQPVHVVDLASTIANAASLRGNSNLAMNLPGPEPVTFRAVIDAAAAAMGRRPLRLNVPVAPLRSIARRLEARSVRSPFTCEQLDRLVEDKVFDPSLARDRVGHNPRPFAEGIRLEVALLGLCR